MKRSLTIAICLLLLLVSQVQAQSIVGHIEETRSQKGLADCEVILDPIGLTTTSDKAGDFQFGQVDPGRYILRINSAKMPQPVSYTHLTLPTICSV